MERYKILIVEDDEAIAEALKQQLSSWNLSAEIVSDFRNVMAAFCAYTPHLVLLDIALPFYNGYYWCEEIRKVSKVPIIFLSSASDNMNIVMAINMGGDDFVAKPFDRNVLLAKVQALLRRTYDFSVGAELVEHNGLILNLSDMTVSYRGERVELTKNEYRILQVLLENKEKTVSRERLMQRLWETDWFVDENTLTVNMTRLRKKLAQYGVKNYIVTKKGVGYMIP